MAVATHQWTSDERFAVARTVARTGITASAVIVITTLLAEAPFLSYAWQVPMGRRSQLFLFLAPSALPVAIPIGLTLGLIVGLEGRVVSRHVVRILLGFAVVASMFSFIDLAWITPAANQAFRVAVFGGPVAPGLPELPLGQLVRRKSSARVPA